MGEKFKTPVNFEVEDFLNEETQGVLTDTVIYFYDQHLTWLSQLKPNAKIISRSVRQLFSETPRGGGLHQPPRAGEG